MSVREVNGVGILRILVLIAFYCCLPVYSSMVFAEDVVKIGLNYPETGPYAKQGLDQKRAAELAVEEINAAGGILGKKVQLVYKDSKANAKIAKENAIELYEKEGVLMVSGESSSGAAIANGKIAKKNKKLAMPSLTYSTETTGEEGHKFIFRECYDSRMAARVLADYLNNHFAGKKYFYITADYTWGWTTEAAVRRFTNTADKDAHKSILTKLGTVDFKDALKAAETAGAEVLVLVQFGADMENSVKQAYELGLKKKVQIVVPNLTEDMADGAGPEAIEGVLGALPWTWKLPFDKNYPKGKAFVESYREKYKRNPTTSGASTYVILYQYKAAVERAKSFDASAVITALEGHRYTGLKDEQYWREFDHQSVQTVYAVKAKDAAKIKKDELDYFDIIAEIKGDDAAISQKEWIENRAKVNAPDKLED
jgi:branched-chain amino acid transport system substrate-binding protein